MIQEIYIIDDDESSIPIFKELFKEEKEFKFIGVKTEQIDVALKNIPFKLYAVTPIVLNPDVISNSPWYVLSLTSIVCFAPLFNVISTSFISSSSSTSTINDTFPSIIAAPNFIVGAVSPTTFLSSVVFIPFSSTTSIYNLCSPFGAVIFPSYSLSPILENHY